MSTRVRQAFQSAAGAAGGLPPTGYFINNLVIESIDLTTTGNAVDYADTFQIVNRSGSAGNSTRGIIKGGQYNGIQYFEFGTGGNAAYFGGQLDNDNYYPVGANNETRAVFFPGVGQRNSNRISYVTMATLGNAVDFGNTVTPGSYYGDMGNSATRGLYAPGLSNSASPTYYVTYVTFATTGNATNFGFLTTLMQTSGRGNSVRGLTAGGVSASNYAAKKAIYYATIATTGTQASFGELSTESSETNTAASQIYALWNAIGATGGGSERQIEYVTIATTGNAVSWGDTVNNMGTGAATSNVHGAIGA
jgi:hypothetical protein